MWANMKCTGTEPTPVGAEQAPAGTDPALPAVTEPALSRHRWGQSSHRRPQAGTKPSPSGHRDWLPSGGDRAGTEPALEGTNQAPAGTEQALVGTELAPS